jgi:hypothetical protein
MSRVIPIGRVVDEVVDDVLHIRALVLPQPNADSDAWLENLLREMLGMPPLEPVEEPNLSAIAAALPAVDPRVACSVGG